MLYYFCIAYLDASMLDYKKLSGILKQCCSASMKAVRQRFSLQIVIWQKIMESFHFPGIDHVRDKVVDNYFYFLLREGRLIV